MHRNVLAGLAGCAIAAPALASVGVTATFTADNHYAIYAVQDGQLTLIGGNELGPAGDPGVYNWSEAETFTFTTHDVIYVAAWSDDAYNQAFLGDVQVGSSLILSGDPRWEVVPTGLDRDDGDPYPTAAEVTSIVNGATTGALWEAPYMGAMNGALPWGTITGITAQSRWMWWNNPSSTNPTEGFSDAGEYIVFRLVVPGPGAWALALGAGVVLARRRR